MSSLPGHWITPEEYIERETKSESRHEYHDGQMFAMAGGSEAHAAICMNIGAAIRPTLFGTGCRILSQDFRVVVAQSQTIYYPDLVILCGTTQPHPRFPNSATNPKVIIEVLSPSTESYDRGRKAEQYAKIPTLDTYVLVSQSEFAVDLFERQQDDTWLQTRLRGPEAVLPLKSVNVSVPLSAIYAEIDFSQSEA